MKIEVTDAPRAEDEAFVIEQTRAYNRRYTERDVRVLCVFARAADGTLVGGLTGMTYWQYLEVSYLWVSEAHRGAGHATKLMRAAEDEARARGCRHALVDTFSFQAPRFYERVGYREFGRLPGFAGKHDRHFLHKELGDGDAMRAIHADGLVLEPQREAHAEEMFAVLCDPAIYEYENEPPASVERLRERFRKLESRRSDDGRERWLNWVVRLPDSRLAGYVQATVHPDGRAAIAYVLASAWWDRGLGRRAVEAMIAELAASHGVHEVTAVLKRGNRRSRRLLERLGFSPAPAARRAELEVEAGEDLMQRDLPR